MPLNKDPGVDEDLKVEEDSRVEEDPKVDLADEGKDNEHVNGSKENLTENLTFIEKLKQDKARHKQKYNVLHNYPELKEQAAGLDAIEMSLKASIKLKQAGEEVEKCLSENELEAIKDQGILDTINNKKAFSEHLAKSMELYGASLCTIYNEYDMRASMARRGEIDNLTYTKNTIYLLFDRYLNLHEEIHSKSIEYSFFYEFDEGIIHKIWERYHTMYEDSKVTLGDKKEEGSPYADQDYYYDEEE